MTEQEWLPGEDVGQLIEYLRAEHGIARTKAGKRRLRLFACACIRRAWPLLDDESKAIVESLERVCDGIDPTSALKQLAERASENWQITITGLSNRWEFTLRQSLHFALGTIGNPSQCASIVARIVAQAQALSKVPTLDHSTPEQVRELNRLLQEESAAHQAVLRDVFGNPFRPLTKRKFPGEVRGLAKAWNEGDGSVLPILADALADLGEDDGAEHLRQPSHVKGCHVVDWVRGIA